MLDHLLTTSAILPRDRLTRTISIARPMPTASTLRPVLSFRCSIFARGSHITRRPGSQPCLSSLFYFLEAEKLTFIYTAAALRRSVPGCLIGQIQIPERPDLALHRPDRVYPAALIILSISHEGAVSVSLFGQADAPTYPMAMFTPQFAFAYFQELCNFWQFSFCYPDVSRLAATALTALLADKVQALRVPFSSHSVCLPFMLILSQLLTANDLSVNR